MPPRPPSIKGADQIMQTCQPTGGTAVENKSNRSSVHCPSSNQSSSSSSDTSSNRQSSRMSHQNSVSSEDAIMDADPATNKRGSNLPSKSLLDQKNANQSSKLK